MKSFKGLTVNDETFKSVESIKEFAKKILWRH